MTGGHGRREALDASSTAYTSLCLRIKCAPGSRKGVENGALSWSSQRVGLAGWKLRSRISDSALSGRPPDDAKSEVDAVGELQLHPRNVHNGDTRNLTNCKPSCRSRSILWTPSQALSLRVHHVNQICFHNRPSRSPLPFVPLIAWQ